jgi:hypothetical protein
MRHPPPLRRSFATRLVIAVALTSALLASPLPLTASRAVRTPVVGALGAGRVADRPVAGWASTAPVSAPATTSRVGRVPALGGLPPAPLPPARWTWPLAPRPQVVRRFEPPDSPWGSGHRGVDLLATARQPVRAAGAGTVTFAGLVAGRGVVALSHGTIRTTYEPVDAHVRLGDHLDAGDSLGELQPITTHCAPRACLHWGALRDATYIDPLQLLGTGRPRLLPLDDQPPTIPPGDEPAPPTDPPLPAPVTMAAALAITVTASAAIAKAAASIATATPAAASAVAAATATAATTATATGHASPILATADLADGTAAAASPVASTAANQPAARATTTAAATATAVSAASAFATADAGAAGTLTVPELLMKAGLPARLARGPPCRSQARGWAC